jgi:outer membrane protein assembly factor BamB
MPNASIPLVLLACAAAAADEWPAFRGPAGDGRSDAKTAPLQWAEGAANVVWKTPVPGRGWSSPVVAGGRVWMTAAERDDRDLFAVCVDLADGRTLHRVKVFALEGDPPKRHKNGSVAAPTPVAADGKVWVHFGTHGTACLDAADGSVLWRRTDLTLDHKEGPGSSPLPYRDLLILPCDGTDVQYLVALDKTTGKTVWKTARSADFSGIPPDQRKAYGTPVIAEVDGRRLLVSCGAKAAYAYDPDTGRELWRVRYKGWSNVSQPVWGAGAVFLNTGFVRPEIWAVRPDGTGDVTDTHVGWRAGRGVPAQSSPILVDGVMYFCSDGGVASALDAKTGEQIWQQRLGGQFSASPILAAGRLYFCGEDGRTTVLRPGRPPEILAVNKLDGVIKASPAPADGALLIRTDTHLYRIRP